MSLADDYARQHRWRSWSRIYDELPLKPSDLVVDLGCAIGDQAADLAARGARVIGVDANVDLLAVARNRKIPGATFVEADLFSWMDSSLAADGLWCSFAPAYFTDLVPVLRRWTAALRSGAWIALVEIDELFGHEPMSAATKAAFSRYCDEGLLAKRYDFRMGRRLAACAAAAGLTVLREMALPDQEFSFSGPASPDVLEAWALRLSRMPLLQRFFGSDWESARAEFLGCLGSAVHTSTSRVVFVLARSPRS